ncbi:Uncharacterized protein HZ326_30099 [Fusarium oxysporum f. sp. albedinis]|nr:Uncharacterized protein HZ326_30099 [Fusarium oxysporum f. sp. albedinis]
MPESSNEAKIILALQALQNDPKLSLRKAAAIYHVDRFTLSRRRHGILSKLDQALRPTHKDPIEGSLSPSDPRWARKSPLCRLRDILRREQHYHTLHATSFASPTPAS